MLATIDAPPAPVSTSAPATERKQPARYTGRRRRGRASLTRLAARREATVVQRLAAEFEPAKRLWIVLAWLRAICKGHDDRTEQVVDTLFDLGRRFTQEDL